MKIDAKCVLASGKKVDIPVDLDYVESIAEVFDYVNNEPAAFDSLVLKIENEAEIEKVLNENKYEDDDLDVFKDCITLNPVDNTEEW